MIDRMLVSPSTALNGPRGDVCPEPATIGRTESHGCVRLTNWDAVKLAGMVKPGTRVVFSE